MNKIMKSAVSNEDRHFASSTRRSDPDDSYTDWSLRSWQTMSWYSFQPFI